MNLLLFLVSLFTLNCSLLFGGNCSQKVIICGVAQNVGFAVSSTIRNVEELGKHFAAYEVIIYENNSTDQTVSLFSKWALNNPKVTFLTETLPSEKLPQSRFAKIARARNCVLAEAREAKYESFDLLIMADLDFILPWPVQEIINSANSPFEWDSISANGIAKNETYYDRLAFRSNDYPFGPEVLGMMLWINELRDFPFKLSGKNLYPVYSAFGGLTLYKTCSILPCHYSGEVTPELKEYYQTILSLLTPHNHQLKNYLAAHKISHQTDLHSLALVYPCKECCEHLTLHAQMALNGHGKFFVNPMMVMRY